LLPELPLGLVFAISAGRSWRITYLACDKNNGFVSGEAIFEKHLPLIREAARNDYSTRMDGRFVPYGGKFWGRRRETAPKTPLSRDGPGMDSRGKYQYMEGYYDN
jgi:hypothetical protein